MQNPPPHVGPRNPIKLPRKYKNGHFRAIFVFFSVFFSYFNVPQSETQVKLLEETFKETDEKRGEILAKLSVDFRPSISREIGHKNFHTNSSTYQDLKFHTAEPKFFHSDTLGVGGPNKWCDPKSKEGKRPPPPRQDSASGLY